MCIEKKKGFLKVEKYSFKVSFWVVFLSIKTLVLHINSNFSVNQVYISIKTKNGLYYSFFLQYNPLSVYKHHINLNF